MKKLILESLLFLFIGIYTINVSLGSYVQYINNIHIIETNTQHIKKIRQEILLIESQPYNNNTKSYSSNIIYVHKNKTQSFNNKEIIILTNIANLMKNDTKFIEFLDKSFIMNRNEFMQLATKQLIDIKIDTYAFRMR